MNPEMLKILACPRCKTELSLEKKKKTQKLKCQKCQEVYKVQEGILQLVVEEMELVKE